MSPDLIQSRTFKGGFPLRDQILEINLKTSYFKEHLSVSASDINNILIWMAQLFKSFEFGNGISEENLAILEFKYLQNKKW